MAGFGNVDMVIADIAADGSVKEFISVELQAMDFNGTVEPAYTALVNNVMLDKKPSYGPNWANVRKRYISQLITKGIYHHHWRTRLVSIIQEPLYTWLKSDLEFVDLAVDDKAANIIFMTYDFEDDLESEVPGAKRLVLNRVSGTSQSSLMTSALYRLAPDKQVFCKKILARLD